MHIETALQLNNGLKRPIMSYKNNNNTYQSIKAQTTYPIHKNKINRASKKSKNTAKQPYTKHMTS